MIRAFVLSTLLMVAPAEASPIATAIADAHSQRRVVVEGQRHLNLFCLGHGRPIVVLEAGSGGSTADWWRIQERLATVTRTCAYDRAGYGYSDPAPRPSSAEAAVDDLHRLIDAAHLGPRPVIVGHSNGGFYATLYAERHPAALGGLVLVDPGFPGQQDYARYGLVPADASALRGWTGRLIGDAGRCLAAALQGTLDKGAGDPACVATPRDDPAILRAALHDIYVGAAYEAANLSEFQNSFAADPDGTTPDDRAFPTPLRPLGSLPLVVLTADHHPVPVPGFDQAERARFWSVWKQGHDRLARLSTVGEDRVVAGSSHFIQNDRPDAVLAAVSEIVADVRGERPAR